MLKYIKDILEAVKQRYRVDGNAEITIECNPGTINSRKRTHLQGSWD